MKSKGIAKGQRAALSGQELRRYKDQIVELRQRGCLAKNIPAQLNLPVGLTRTLIRELIQEGRTQPVHDVGTCRDIESGNVQTIIAMRKQRATLQEIGAMLSISKQRVLQLIRKITALYGGEVLQPTTAVWTSQEVAKDLGVPRELVNSLCATGQVDARRRSNTNTYLIAETELRKLRRYARIATTAICATCGEPFVKRSTALTCSKKCRKARKKTQMKDYGTQPPSADSLEGWHKELWDALLAHPRPADEQWLSIGEAHQLTGLSMMQLSWLRVRRIVTIRRDPLKTNHCQPVALYAKSELIIAQRIAQDFNRLRRKGARR